MATDNKRKLYDALSQDYDMGSYEQFCADLNDEAKRRKLYDATSQDYDLGTWDSFSQQLGYGQAAAHTPERPAAPVDTLAAPTPPPASPKDTQYFKLRRGGKDFTVSTDEVNAAGGLTGWAKANPGAPLRVYMQGTNEDGKPFDCHVDLSVAHDRSKRRGYKYTTTSTAIEDKPWQPTEQQKIAMSRQLHQMQEQTDAMFAESRERMENVSEYYRGNRGLGFHTVEGKPVFNPETGKMEKTYLTPTGDRTTSKTAADMSTYNFRQAMAAADMSVGAQIRRAEAELAELRKQLNESSERVYQEWAEDYEKNDAPLAAVLAANTYVPRQTADKENSALRVAIRQREEQLKNLYEERDRQIGKDVGFWRGFGRTVSDVRTWDFGTGDLLDAMTMLNADKYSAPDATEGEKRAGQAMMRAVYDAQQTEQMFGENASFWNRAGVMTGYMPSFMVDFALTGGGFEAIDVAGKAATRGAVKVIGKEAIEEMVELGVKEYAKKYGVRGVGRMAGNWSIKALGTTADDLLIRAPLMTNTVQAGKTTADIIDRKLGDVVVDENGNYDFSNDKTWGSAIWQGEANAIIENYSEMFGTHLDGVVPALAKTFGGKRISGMLARANASSYGQILATTRKQFERLGVSDYFGEVSEEYYGQLWRTMLNLDDAYTNVPVYDGQGNQVLDADGNPVYERKNLLFTGQFHGDIWGGMALSMGLMGAGKYAVSGIAYGNMKHQVNVADRVAAEIFTPDRWEPIREIIDNTTNDDMGALAESMVNDPNLSDEERAAVMGYMERSLNLRGLNLGAMAQSRGAAEGDDALPVNIEVDSELSQSYIDGYEASSPQEMNDAQNMYEYQRQRAESMFEPTILDWLDTNPVNALVDISLNGLYSQEEIEAARDYINAKTVRDGIIQRVNDNIDEQIAQSDAMINARINRASGMIQPAVMGLDDRQVYVVGGTLAVNENGTIDRDASDESIVVRDAVTGELKFADPKSIVSAGEAIDPEMEKAIAVDNIRQQAAQAAVDAMNGTLAFNPGDVVEINDGSGLSQVTIIGPVIDEESGMPIEGQVYIHDENRMGQVAVTKDWLQQVADAANLERLNNFEQDRAANRAQQHTTEAEAMRPQFALNDEFTILNDSGTPIRGSITGELDEDGTVEIYTEEPINGNRVNRFTPAELEEMFDTYNGETVALPVPENVETVPKIEETPENGGEISENPVATVPNPDNAVQAEPQVSALSRIPVDEQGQPKYDDVDPETAWDAIVEQAQGDEVTAAEVVADIVDEHQADFNAAEKALNKTKEGKPEKRKKDDPAPTMEERIAAKNAAKEALAEAQAIRDRAKAALDHWKKIAGTKQRRENERRNAEEAEARRRAQERAEEEARLKAEREEAERIEREALNGVPDWSVDTPQDARARGYRRNGPQKVDRPEIIDNHAIGNSVEVKFGDDVMPTGNIVVVEASQLQPSHRDGQRNPAHFLDEAQPKERKDAASRFAAAKIAEAMRPEEITSSVTAYTGAPSINPRGEVIQGNNRSEALRIMYERFSQSAERYKQYLIDHAAEFGLTPEAIAAFEQPVLVNMLDVSDEDAITLGQYVAQDTESGGIERIKPKNAVQKMGDKIRTFANLLLRSSDDEATFAQLVDTNGLEVLKWMNQQGYITNTQYASAFDSKGNLSAEAANDLKGIMYQSIFTGGSTRLEEMFNKMPAKAQRAILATAFRDYDSPFADRMINEIQQSIIAYNALMGYEQFRDATNAEATMLAVEAWRKQSAFDDVTGEPYLPSETFSNFALALAAMYKGQTQRHIQSVFNMMYDIVQGTEQDNLFEVADKTPKPLAEAIRRVLNLEYQPVTKPTTDNGTNGSAVLDVNSEDGQDWRPGSDGNADGAEQSQEEAEPSDSGTGTTSDSGQGVKVATEEADFSPEEIEALSHATFTNSATGQTIKLTGHTTMPDGRPAFKGNMDGGRGSIGRFMHNLIRKLLNSPSWTTDAVLPPAQEAHDFNDLDISAIAERVDVAEDDWTEGDEKTPTYKRTITIDGKHEVIQVDEPNSEGFYTGSYFEYHGEQYGSLTEVIEHIDKQAKLAADIAVAEAEVNTDPTPAQKEAGNYKKGHVQVGTFDVTIEQPVGSVRRGTDADGKEWETTMQNTYGYIRGTEGVDGDHIDVFLSTDIDGWNGRRVVIVDQYNPDGTFDEHKVMLGFNDKADAINAYLANYEEGWEKGRRLVFSTATLEDFEKWIESSHRKQKPYHEYKIAEKAEVDESTPENPISATDYTIDTYATKKNKTYLRVIFPRADKEVWQKRLNLAKKMGGTSVPKGYGFKTREEAEAFAKAVADPTAVADAQPLSLEDIRGSIIEEPTTTSSTEAEQSSETETQPEVDNPVNPSGNKLVTDERYAELRERMRKKLGGQLNMGVDPEILAIGTEMAVYHIEKGARKFKAYASAMIADLGDAIRPYLKSFYNAVRDMPEAEAAGLIADMDSYDEVRSVDIANFDKPGTNAMATAATVVAEQEAEKEKEEAERKLKEKRKKRTNPDGSTTETVVESGTEIEITSGDFIPGVHPIVDAQKPSGKKKPSKEKPKSTTDGGLFDTVEDDTTTAPAITVPEQRPTADLMGDSAAFQEREAQTVELVEEIGGVIESRVAMLQLDAESVKPLNMTDIKKMASKYPALKGISDTDLQELVELAMTQLTRSEALVNIDGTAEAQRAAYDYIVNLYQIQPSLNARDSERLIKQQYSTPTPFGYVMGQFVRAGGKTVGSMLEPSAGNGALTITVHPSVIHVNDIDDARLANLRKLGYGQVTAQDALLPFDGDKVDVVMTNPPFGTVTEKVYDGVFRISSLEGQMAINALEQMKDDGRAAIVIGGNTSYRTNGSMNPKDAAFFGYLYSHYNVADVINISGKALYSRNGTGYDVRMILIDGRKIGEFQRVFPPVKAKARAEQVTTFDELYKRVQDDIQQIQQVGSQSADVQREPEAATDGTASAPVRTGSNRPNTGAGQRPSTTSDAVRDTPRTVSGQPATVDDGSSPAGVDNADSGNAGSTDNVPQPNPQQPRSVGGGSAQDGTGRSGSDGRGTVAPRPDSRAERLEVKPDLTTEKVPYPNQSENGFTLMSVVPAAQAQVLQKSLAEIGDVDQFLVDELGYSSKEELYGYLAAEQVDSVALAIHQMNKGNAFIIGDMTGVGKGRQGAALIRYAVKQGKVPIYFTQKPTLFTDNYRDLSDIGSRDLRPFIIASNPKDANIVDTDGNVVHKLPSKKEQERVFNYIMEHGTLPEEYDYVLTTYDQIKNGTADYTQNEDGTWNTEARKLPKKSKGYTTADYNGQARRDALAQLAEGNIAILDESHTVGGDSGCGRYMQMLTSSAEGVTFLSATFAKRADNMPIYAQRTAIAEAGVKASELIEAISKGGVTLQEIMSKQLVESGQMIRRERSFEGVTIDWLSVEEETDRRQRQQFNEVADIFNAIRNFQDDYITPIIDAKNEAAAEHGATVGHTQGTKDLGVKNVPFASKMYNLVNQLLFALKVDAVADRVVENLRNGYKPVISFTNTMEGFLSSAPKGVVMDDVPNFSLTLMRALDGVMRFTEKDADENSEGGSISLSELSAEGQKAYNAIRDKIINLSADLPISPMDAIRMKIEEAGYSVAEITGRTMQLNRTDDGRYIVEARKDRDKKAAMRDFNSGKLDVLMINKSGSTGISLHASSKFEDQRPRVMVFAQFQSDINDEVQMRGRIDRSGQVTRGRYEYIMSTIPAEQRIQMMFKAKLKSLDANTTSSQKSKFNEMEIVDYLNKYGDDVVWEYMKEHPELEERLGDPLSMLQEKQEEDGPRTSEKEDTSKKTGCAGKISRYLAFLSVEEQDEIFREITEAYRVKIQLLDDAGENDLEITTMPLRAETKRKQIWHEGENPGSGNAFADNTYVEEVEVDVLKKPMKRAEIAEATRKLMGEHYTEKNGGVDWQHYARAKGDEISLFFQAKADEAVGKLKEAGEARIAKARERAVTAATKARGRGENNFTDEEIQSLADTVANEERNKEEQKQRKRQEEIMAIKHRLQSLLQRLRAGSIYVVPQDLKQGTAEMFSQTFGTFVGFKFNKGYTLGSSTAIFATLDGRRKVELALSDPAISTIISATEIAYRYSPKEINAITMENWDSKVPTQTRQKRYIITGNLLQALVDTEKGEKTRGNLISYSTIDGETRQGILMGENFKLTDLRNSASLSSRLAQIREGKAVVSENGDVQIEKVSFGWQHRGQYELRVPKSKQRGGIYTMHSNLLKLVEGHNFITKGNNMVAYVDDTDIAKVVDMLSRAPFNLTVLQESQLTDVSAEEAEDDVLCRSVTDKATLDRLNSEPTIKVYRAMQMIDGGLRPPMSGKVYGEWREATEVGIWEEAEEHPEMADEKGRFKLDKGNGKSIKAAYNPYIHTSRTPINDQFSSAWSRPELVIVEVEVPLSELTSGYRAEKAKDTVGEKEWKSGPVGRALAKIGQARRVILSRWSRIVRVVPVEEVAEAYAQRLNAHGIEVPFNTVPPALRDALAERGVKIGKPEKGNAGSASLPAFQQWINEQERQRMGDGYGAYSDAEVSLANDPISKVMGKNRFSKKRQAEFAARERQRMADRIKELAERMHLDNVEILTDASQLEGKRAKAKGFYNKRTGKITIVIPNNVSTIDAEQTLLHEAVAHYGLRQLFGEQFNTFLDNVYQSADESIRRKIAEMAAQNGWDFRTATEEYLAGLAEDTNFREAQSYSGWWSKIKRLFLDMLSHIGFEGFRDKVGVVLTDNELRYILWRSYENLAEPGRYRSIFGEAADVAKQSELKVGNYAEQGIEADYAAEGDLYRSGDFSPRDRVYARYAYESMVRSGSYQFKEAVQDSMLGLKKLYQAILGKETRIEDVPGFENAYLFENRMSSMNAGEQHEYFQRYMQPLLKEIGRLAGASIRRRRELTDYIMAKHGLERNEYMRNEAASNGEDTDRDFAGLMGLTGEADWRSAEATAQQWVDDYESMVDTTALWEAINQATKATLEKVYLSGIISKETYEKILGMYDYYVPLRGWNETTSEQVYGYLTSKDGPLGGSIMKKAEGRESMADDPIATIGMMADDAIRQGNRNLMKQRFLNFILNHPSDAVSVHDIWLKYNDVTDEWVPVFADVEDTDTADEVAQKVEAFERRMEALRTAEPDKYKKGRETQHIPYKVVRNNLREHQILIKRGGRTFVATINGNPRAAQAINGLTNPDVDQNGVVGNMLKLGTWVNRQLSAFYTTRNPDFVVGNFFRDMLYSNCMTWVKESPRYARRFSKNFARVNPIVMRRLLGKWEKGNLNMSNRIENLFYQFMKNGGETGYTNVRDIEGHKRAVAAELKKQGSTGRRVWTALGMQLDLLNRSAENCARFAAFVTSRDFGRSIDRAIYDAKEISVNFNKKGSGGKMVNANGQTALGKTGAYLSGGGRLLYVFWNAGVQGMTNFGRQAKLHPAKFSVGATALFTLGYVIPLMAQMLGGGDGDDDDKNAYYNLPEYVRRSNICFYAGDQWITIPLPIEYRAIYGMGELAHGVISGNERYSDSELAQQMASQVSQIFPIDMLEGGGGISPFIPSAAKPLTEAYILNKGWTGLPVYKDTPFNKNDPEWTKAYVSTDKHLVAFAKWLNETSGGDDFKKGSIDINPAKIEYLLNGTFGGLFTFPNKVKKTGETMFGDRYFEWRNIPIANRLIKSGDERTANRKLQNEYFKYFKEYKATGQLLRKYENADEDGIMGYAERINFLENSPEYARWEIFDEFKADIDAYREDISAEADKEERARLEAEMYAVMRELVNALHDPEAYRNSEQE
jgi:predicted RNA methylase